jgi:transposase, IS5 family
MKQAGFFDLPDHMKRLSEAGDPLEMMARIVNFSSFRPLLEASLGLSKAGSQGGRPPYDAVKMFKVLILQAQNNLSDERMEFLIRDRLSWLRFLDFELGEATPDENTIRLYRERLTNSGAIKRLFQDFDTQLRRSGYLAMGGQIMDATLVSAPRQHNTDAEKAAIKVGKTAAEIWPDKPAKAAQKDVDARWTVKFSKAKTKPDGTKPIDIAIPIFGYKNHIGIDRRFGFIRTFKVTHAARNDGAQLPDLIDEDNTASSVWADTAYRSQKNEDHLKAVGKVSQIHRKKPKGKPMTAKTRAANARKSSVRVHVEHVFAVQKNQMRVFIRTIGKARAEAKLGLANLAYNIKRLIFHEKRRAIA